MFEVFADRLSIGASESHALRYLAGALASRALCSLTQQRAADMELTEDCRRDVPSRFGTELPEAVALTESSAAYARGYLVDPASSICLSKSLSHARLSSGPLVG